MKDVGGKSRSSAISFLRHPHALHPRNNQRKPGIVLLSDSAAAWLCQAARTSEEERCRASVRICAACLPAQVRLAHVVVVQQLLARTG